MSLLYAVDFRTLANQTLGAAGSYTIDGKTWYAKGQLTDGSTTIISNVVNGSGIHFDVTGGAGTTQLSQSSAIVWRHLFFPLTQLADWDAGRAYMVRARFAFNGAMSNSKPFIGVISTTSDSVAVTAGQRAGEIFVAPSPADVTTNLLAYKIGTAAKTTATGRAGTIANSETVVGVYHFTNRFALLGSEHLASGMPTDPATWLAVQSVAAADFDGLRSNPGVILTLDSGNNDWYLQQLRIETIGDTFDGTPPTVELISPPVTQRIGRKTPIVVRVTDETSLTRVYVWVRYEYGSELIYSSTEGFSTAFAGESSVSGTNPRTFTIVRTGGWLGKPTVYVEPIDSAGNTVTS